MSGNTIGKLFCVTSFGESHGPAIGCVVDGCPPGMDLSAEDIQHDLDRRRPGTSRHVTQRREPDTVEILSGVFEGKTTGAPLALLIRNQDQRSKDYTNIMDAFRPGHADYTYWQKYGTRDYRGGGRSSARETAARVAAGAIARKVVPELRVRGALVQIGPHRIDRARWDWDEVERNPFFCPDAERAEFFAAYLDGVRRAGSSVGAVVEVVAENVPPGLGAPVYGKLDAELAGALMSINAVKGVEIGAGFAAVEQKGTEHRDEITPQGFLSNHAGGILGGISSGQDILVSIALKPTSSLPRPQPTVTRSGEPTEIATRGRHDPCLLPRFVVMGEAMFALVLVDHWLRWRAQCKA